MNASDLIAATECEPAVAAVYAPLLDKAMTVEGMDTVKEQAGFIGQCAFESNRFTRLEEILNYSAERLVAVWPARFRMPVKGEEFTEKLADGKRNAELYANQPQALAEFVYGGRMGNALEGQGDGFRYRGRGLFQITGKANYKLLGDHTSLPTLAQPDLLIEPVYAVQAAQWFWWQRGLGNLAKLGEWALLTRAINGGLDGLSDRVIYIERALAALGD